MENEIGQVTHWYDKISVAVIKLSAPLKIGDRVRVETGKEDFEETVSSMQIDRKDVSAAIAGDEVAVKLGTKTKEGAKVYLAE